MALNELLDADFCFRAERVQGLGPSWASVSDNVPFVVSMSFISIVQFSRYSLV